MAFLGNPAYTVWTPASTASSWEPAETIFYVKSGVGLVFIDNKTLLPGSAISTAGEPISLGTDGAQLFLGTETPPFSTILGSPAATGLSSTATTLSVPSTATATTSTIPTSTIPTSTSVSASTPSSTSNSLSTPPPSPTATHSSKSTVSAGGAAGIGVGCAIAGAAIAFLLFWFFKRTSKNQNNIQDQEAGATFVHRQEKQPAVNVQPVDNANLISRIVDNNLPQPLEDNAIAGEISKISNLIKNHVQSYYHSARVGAGAVDLDALQALGGGLPVSIGTLNTMLTNSTTRETALRLCIARAVISRIQFEGDPRTTFLPPEVINCISAMTGLESKPQVRTAFLSRWRTLTAELMQTTYGRNAFSANDPRNHNILKAVEVLDAVLHPYADERMDNNQRLRNLEEFLKRAASFAFMLFSQPSSWKLEWENPRGHEPGSLVIFPALVQVVDETGRSLSPPRPFSEVVVRQIDG